MERAARAIILPGFAERHTRVDEFDDVDAAHQVIDELLGNAAGHKARLKAHCRRPSAAASVKPNATKLIQLGKAARPTLWRIRMPRWSRGKLCWAHRGFHFAAGETHVCPSLQYRLEYRHDLADVLRSACAGGGLFFVDL